MSGHGGVHASSVDGCPSSVVNLTLDSDVSVAWCWSSASQTALFRYLAIGKKERMVGQKSLTKESEVQTMCFHACRCVRCMIRYRVFVMLILIYFRNV